MKHKVMFILAWFALSACSGTRPTNLGVMGNGLAPCPGKPNCVVSDEADTKHYVEPIAYSVDRQTAVQALKDVLKGMKGAEIIEETPAYLRLEFRTRIFGFVDDVEFFFPDKPVILVRSASRLGYSDLGVNRKRIEKVRAAFDAQIKNMALDQEK